MQISRTANNYILVQGHRKSTWVPIHNVPNFAVWLMAAGITTEMVSHLVDFEIDKAQLK